jgi:flavin prenyltransferase
MQRLIIGISGASGAIYGQRLLELARANPGVETHLILSDAAARTIEHELGLQPEALSELADVQHDNANVGAGPASGSFQALGMIIAPCSIRTLSAIAYSHAANLLQRSADVMLEERRPLILQVRETPLHLGHLRAMTQAAECGAIIAPPVPAFYQHPASLDDMVTQTCARLLGLLGLNTPELRRWEGLPSA